MKMFDMCYALTDFCIEQNSNDNYCEDSIEVMMGELLYYCDRRIGPAEIAADPINRYRIFTYGKEHENVMPQNIRDNDVLCSNGIFLCTVDLKSIYTHGKNMSSSYEVVYDCDDDIIRLFYTVMLRDEDVITVYRTETDSYKDFDFFEFYMELSNQLKSSIDEVFA